MAEESNTTVDFIRHGEPVGGRRYRGQTDDPLSEKGWGQMRAAVGEHRLWSAIVSSPLSRCAAFAQELSNRLEVPLELDDRLMELGFGAWEGRTAAEIMADDADRLMRFWSDPQRHAPPGGESLHGFRSRIVGSWADIIEKYHGRHVLVVCHAGTIRMVMTHVLEMPLDKLFRIQVPNAGITRVRVDRNGAGVLPRLIFHAGKL